jgi:hypothetical protein
MVNDTHANLFLVATALVSGAGGRRVLNSAAVASIPTVSRSTRPHGALCSSARSSVTCAITLVRFSLAADRQHRGRPSGHSDGQDIWPRIGRKANCALHPGHDDSWSALDRPRSKSWLGETEQSDEWNFCLMATRMVADVRDDEQWTTPEPQSGLQGQSGASCHERRKDPRERFFVRGARP